MTVKKYKGAAGGWGSLVSTGKHLFHSENVAKNVLNLLKTNQDHGFDCPGCAWGEEKKSDRFKFCENGAKAVNWEATSRRLTADFFEQYTVSMLRTQSDYFLEDQGRLSVPLLYQADLDKYVEVTWEDAFKLTATHLNALEDPNQAEFYTSGRASNEAAFLYQLFVRKFGSNNFPDCSNMCHEASGVGLKKTIGVGKGTVTLEDFDHADAIFVFGQNPGTNHPRMLHTLNHAVNRGANIVTFNTLKERGLERFANPQSPANMVLGTSTKLSSLYFTPNLGGDMAAVRGMVKILLARHEIAQESGQQVFDVSFIEENTTGLEDYLAQVKATTWEQIIDQSGLSKEQITKAADVYQQAERVIVTWAMGVTQHRHSVATVTELANLQLLFGQIGKKGGGVCPVRGHSNVQGDRTMGIDEKPTEALLNSIEKAFNFTPPKTRGHNAVQAVEAMLRGESKVFMALGGNFAAAMPDTEVTRQAMSRCELTVNIATKLNRTHLYPGKNALILPCLGRTDIDLQQGNAQKITVEDSFSMVHASQGVVKSDIREMRSEPAIIAGIAQATLGDSPVKWLDLIKDYDQIRDLISQTIPGFSNMNERLKEPGGFYLGNAAAEHQWNTETKKAQFQHKPLPESIVSATQRALTKNPVFVLQTLRSHDQYNTTIYGFSDRYRGLSGDRHIILLNESDITALGLTSGDKVDIEALWGDQIVRKVTNFTVLGYDIPVGNAAAYYPETNPLVALANYGDETFTPNAKSIAIVISAAKKPEPERIV
ncbi:FdhF/YdeP family oxidoreductase [Psychromonas sp. RZ22]|uniref:FdhF/YdeP family oxidoreductase n=1 Tax=Psychromonas algarum TaxID=2555643 RepID=UPI0010674E8B|nr:FdhF/YdeP family oxidoreductase [Psychromonas sp. RZ22]TEW54837.1 FdhF/YdeP family oxidoreductase [Psychromonas sp. RZ22]